MSEMFITFFPIFAHHRAVPSFTQTSSAFKNAPSATRRQPERLHALQDGKRGKEEVSLKKLFCICKAHEWTILSIKTACQYN